MENRDGLEKMYLTKERLLKGASKVEEVETDLGVFRIRALNNGEKAHVESMAVKGLSQTRALGPDGKPVKEGGTMTVDLELAIKNDWDVKFFILSCGLSVEKSGKERWSPGDVRALDLPQDVFDLLLNSIGELSGLKKGKGVAELVGNFPEDDDRAGTGNTSYSWDETGGVPGDKPINPASD